MDLIIEYYRCSKLVWRKFNKTDVNDVSIKGTEKIFCSQKLKKKKIKDPNDEYQNVNNGNLWMIGQWWFVTFSFSSFSLSVP